MTEPREKILHRPRSIAVARLLWLSVAIALFTPALGCAPDRPPVAPIYRATDEGPRFAPWLGLSEEQDLRVTALVAEVERAGEPVAQAGERFVEAMASNLRRCRNDSTWLNLSADGVVRAGQAARDPILDAINELHATLTPAQRRRLAHHLLDEERRSTRSDREEEGEQQTESVGLELDLSWGQIGAIVIRLRRLQSVYEDEFEPWLAHYREAVGAFAEPDFDIRDHAIAKAPILRLGMDLVTDAYRVIVPLLEPDQCRAISDYIERKMAERQAETEREAETRPEGEPEREAEAPR